MICERCSSEMELQYQVVERYNQFTLWNCACGYKFLERERAAELHSVPRVDISEVKERPPQQVF